MAPVTAGPGSYLGSTLAANPNNLAGSCVGGVAPEAVYAVTLASAADLAITTTAGAPLDLGVYVRSAPCAAGAELACEDANGGGAAESIALPDLPAGTYYVVVDGYTAADHGPYGLTLDVRAIVPAGGACVPADAGQRCAAGAACIGAAGAETCAAGTTLLSESFTAGLGALIAADANGDGQGWAPCDDSVACGHSNTTGSASGGPFALIRDGGALDLDGDALQTPALGAAGHTYVVLEFDHAFDHASGVSDLGVVEVSVMGSGTWTPVATYQTDAAGRVRLDLSALVSGQQFTVRFRYDDDTAGGGALAEGWRVDDVRITAL
jgi:hypothetical protein